MPSTSRRGHITLQHFDNTFNEWVDMSRNYRVTTQNLEIRVDVIEGKIICKLLISTNKNDLCLCVCRLANRSFYALLSYSADYIQFKGKY